MTGMIIGSVIAWSTFSHVSIISETSEETLIVKLLIITLIPFTSEFSVSTANWFDPDTFCRIGTAAVDVNESVFPLLVQASESELPVIQVHVTVLPEHTASLSQVTRLASVISVWQTQ